MRPEESGAIASPDGGGGAARAGERSAAEAQRTIAVRAGGRTAGFCRTDHVAPWKFGYAPRRMREPPAPAAPTTMTPPRDDRRLLLLVYAALSVAALVPIWCVRYQPLPDLAVNLAAGSILHHHADPRFDFARYYDLALGLTPYWGYYAPLHLFTFLVDIETANRIILSLYAVGLPVGTALLARRFGRSPWLGLFAFPIVWNFNFSIGFISFCLGLAALPFTLVLFDRLCERPTIGRALAASLGGATIYFLHLLPWGAYLGGAGLIGLLHHGRSPARIAARLGVWLVSLATGVYVTLYGSGLHMGSRAASFAGRYIPKWQSLGEMYEWTWNGCAGREDEILALVLLAGWVLLKLTEPRRFTRPHGLLHDLRAEACFAVGFIAYLVLPRSVIQPDYWWGVNIRFACIAFLFAGLCVEGAIDGWRRLALVPVALAALGFSVDTTVHWVRAARFAAGYDDVARVPEPGSRVLFILASPWHDPSIERYNYVHVYYDIYQAQHGGYMPWNFDVGFPLKYKARYPAPVWRGMQFIWDAHAPYYDYVFVFQADGRAVFREHFPEVKEVAASGKWKLYRLPGPRVDEPPGPAYPRDWAFEPSWRPAKRPSPPSPPRPAK